MAGNRVGVVFGGPSAEHEISIRSADVVASELSAGGVDVVLVHLRRDGAWGFARGSGGGAPASRLAGERGGLDLEAAVARLRADVDVVFPTMHGTFGEDGVLQGFLRLLALPFVGPELPASALAMDKARAKAVLAATTTLRMPRGVAVRSDDPPEVAARALARARTLEPPWIVKPNDAGSSVGLTRVERERDLEDAVARARRIEGVRGVLIEEAVEGDEVTCAVLGNPESGLQALPPILIRPREGRLFDYETKYTAGLAEEICPAPLPACALGRIEADAIDAFVALGARGLARVDFILRDGTPWFLELNTLPGLTRESLVPKAARAAGFALPDFFGKLVELALAGGDARARTAVAS